MEGRTVGKYEILERVAEGGMGIFYRARDTRLDRVVGIKTLHTEFSVDEQLRERFTNEARALAKLNHPNICVLYDFFEEEEQLFIVMEYIEGETLADIVRRQGALETEQVCAVFRQILMALDYAHAKDVIHRDIKPSNIMLSSQGVVKVMDFGIAKIVGASKQLTRTGRKVGSIPYMSPEQITEKAIDPRSDIYSLGIALYQVCTGRVPFDATSDFEVMKQHLECEPPSPRSLRSRIPVKLERIILKAIEKKPDARYQRAAEIRSDLTDVGASRDLVPELVSQEGTINTREVEAPASPRSHRRAMLLGTLALVLGTLVFARWLNRNQPPWVREYAPWAITEPLEPEVIPPFLADLDSTYRPPPAGEFPMDSAAQLEAGLLAYADSIEGLFADTLESPFDSAASGTTDAAGTPEEADAGEALAQMTVPDPPPAKPVAQIAPIPEPVRYFVEVTVRPEGRFQVDQFGWWKRNGRATEGHHLFEAMGPGYPIYQDELFLNDDTTFSIDLEHWSANFALADLRVSARTADDESPRCVVYINGALAGHVPEFRQELRSGLYEIRLMPVRGYRVDSLKYEDQVFVGNVARIRVLPLERSIARFFLTRE